MRLWHCDSIEELNSLSKEDLEWLGRDLIGWCQEHKMLRNWVAFRACETELKLMKARLAADFGLHMKHEWF